MMVTLNRKKNAKSCSRRTHQAIPSSSSRQRFSIGICFWWVLSLLLADTVTPTTAFIASRHCTSFSSLSSSSVVAAALRPCRLARPHFLHIFASTKVPLDKDDNIPQHQPQPPGPKQALTRPERKALERQAKANSISNNRNNNNDSKHQRRNANHRHHNYAERQQEVSSRYPNPGRYDLHSTAVSSLTPTSSSPEDVMRAIKRAQNLHDVQDLQAISRFLLEQTSDSFAYGYKGSLFARLAVAALHLNQHDIARRAMNIRRTSFASSMLPFESAALVRNLLRVHNVSDSWQVLEQELPLPTGTDHDDTLHASSLLETDELVRDRLKHRSLAMASIISRHFFEEEPVLAVQACNKLAREVGPLLHQARLTPPELEMPWPRLLKAASTCQSAIRSGTITSLSDQDRAQLPCNVVYSVLNVLVALPSENSSRTYELLAQALVRRTAFTTGAVSIDKCPPPDRGEAAFIGRSNVGKSSLVNMVTNRKALAYVSKRPGKTRQFNYFAVNERPGYEKEIRYGDFVPGEKDQDSFYIVDLPGFGFARVPEKQRRDWATFMELYISTRRNLRVVFHLIDGRHGPTGDDAEIMQKVSQSLVSAPSSNRVQYVIVLTKADKNAKVGSTAGKLGGKVTPRVMDSLKQVMKDSGVPSNVPVILTSAETKLGRDEMWKYLRLAAESV